MAIYDCSCFKNPVDLSSLCFKLYSKLAKSLKRISSMLINCSQIRNSLWSSNFVKPSPIVVLWWWCLLSAFLALPNLANGILRLQYIHTSRLSNQFHPLFHAPNGQGIARTRTWPGFRSKGYKPNDKQLKSPGFIAFLVGNFPLTATNSFCINWLDLCRSCFLCTEFFHNSIQDVTPKEISSRLKYINRCIWRTWNPIGNNEKQHHCGLMSDDMSVLFTVRIYQTGNDE